MVDRPWQPTADRIWRPVGQPPTGQQQQQQQAPQPLPITPKAGGPSQAPSSVAMQQQPQQQQVPPPVPANNGQRPPPGGVGRGRGRGNGTWVAREANNTTMSGAGRGADQNKPAWMSDPVAMERARQSKAMELAKMMHQTVFQGKPQPPREKSVWAKCPEQFGRMIVSMCLCTGAFVDVESGAKLCTEALLKILFPTGQGEGEGQGEGGEGDIAGASQPSSAADDE
ncbi:unnamed protein product [Vitrella brassicaformis CCMP3155]|uniref:Uncharacterized protein n=1 Tax=Vitrella brassicaformis (strain CCMP3155) TaxID=1169540 RepID=A0A0G4FJ74_VITBC|nr:unnamed protein product [Vitrella brassicaformis CCMP3155]|eukprot:CEM13782.1 unnamed protein product [Vitrella brassicaformis CCMP3155]